MEQQRGRVQMASAGDVFLSTVRLWHAHLLALHILIACRKLPCILSLHVLWMLFLKSLRMRHTFPLMAIEAIQHIYHCFMMQGRLG